MSGKWTLGAALCGPFLSMIVCGHALADAGDGLMHRQPWESCRYCHGGAPADDLPPPVPVIDGQSGPYIEKQLADYRSGRRGDSSMLMGSALLLLDPRNDRAVARHFEHLPPPASAPDTGWSQGASLYWKGRSGVPACAGCHGGPDRGSSLPRVFGQGKRYLLRQLLGFASGARANDRDRVMRRIAVELNTQEMEAVSDYLARH
jgi:cytochrome c553